jgi:DNA-binding transcriptional LysR family regulator
MVRADEADFAVGSMLEMREDIEYQPMFTYGVVLIAGLGHPLARRKRVTLKDIAPHPLILPPSHLTTWRVVDYVFGKQGLKYRVKMEAGGWEVIKKYVALGMGISIVTSICLTGDEKLAVHSLSRYFPNRTYGLVIRKGKFLSPAAERFVDLMRESTKGKKPPPATTGSGQLFGFYGPMEGHAEPATHERAGRQRRG